jgi:U3 small nucleolar ribonucleoprotein protein IMP4
MPLGPTLYLGMKNVVMRHDLKKRPETMSEAYPHMIFDNFKTKLGLRVKNILQHLFPTPKFDSKRVITFSNKNDLISFRHHTYDKQDYKTIDLNEIGPRFELKPYQISLGTMIQGEAQKEWILRPYINTANK